MDKVSETRRGLFEAWYAKQCADNGVKLADNELASMRGEDGGYRKWTAIRCKWEGFNAALDAVEIVLPEPHSTNGGDCVIDYDECRSAIESTNLGLRIK